VTARVLVVDDVLANIKLLEARLTAEYFDVVTAMSGQEALDICAQAQCDIVLLDVMMPGLDGFEVCRALKANPATQHIPVVMVTALDQPSDRVRGLEVGADDFLTKPVSDIALLARVRSLTRMKMMTDELRMRAETTRQIGRPSSFGEMGVESGEAGRILIVDDRSSSYERLQAILDVSHLVDIETSPHEALFRASEGQYDLLIVNLDLEGFDGLRLCSQTRSLERTRNLPILIVAQPDETARVLRALDLGVNDYLVRPIDRNELEARVRTQIRRKRYMDRLRSNVIQSLELALTDPLTGLHNRRYLETHLSLLFDGTGGRERSFSILLVDIDFFKVINDTHGHSAGDDVLREFAKRFKTSLRGIDLACRFGGEEFLVIMPEADLVTAGNIGERVRAGIAAAPFKIIGGSQSVDVTVSIGIATRLPGEVSGETLIKRADEALYRAKRDGRNRVVLDAA